VIHGGELGLQLVRGRGLEALAFTHHLRVERRPFSEPRFQDFADEERAHYADRHG